MQAIFAFDGPGWNPSIKRPKKYVQVADNPHYNKIILLATNQKDVLPTRYIFQCSIGCFLGFEICVLDSNNVPIQLFGCDWSCNAPTISYLLQDEMKTRVAFIEPGEKVLRNSKTEFGWFCSGNFTLSFITKNNIVKQQFQSECNVM